MERYRQFPEKLVTAENETYYTFNIVCASDSFLWKISNFIEEEINETLNVYPTNNNAYILNSVAKRKNYYIYKLLFDNANVFMKRKYDKVIEFFNSYSPKCK